MKVRTFCEFPTSLLTEDSSFDNWTEFIDYINDFIFKRLGHSDTKSIYNSDKFGELSIRVGIDHFIEDFDGKANIFVWIEPKNQDLTYDDDEWYNYMKECSDFVDFLVAEVEEFIKMVNQELKEIKFPKNENLIFKDERFYMEINPLFANHHAEFVPFQMDTEIDRNQLIDNIDG